MVSSFLNQPIFKTIVLVGLGLGCGLTGFLTRLAPYDSHFLVFLPGLWLIWALLIWILLVKQVGLVKGSLIIVLTLLASGGLELAAVATGWPLGFFRYQEFLGPKILGIVPWSIVLFWSPILITSQMLARSASHRWYSFVFGAFFLSLLDLIVDPVAVKLGLWHWLNPGWYYQVPEISFIGGLPTYIVLSGILGLFLPRLPAIRTFYYGVFFWATVALWTAIALAQELWIPSLIGCTFAIWILLTLFKKPTDQDQNRAITTPFLHKDKAYRQRQQKVRINP